MRQGSRLKYYKVKATQEVQYTFKTLTGFWCIVDPQSPDTHADLVKNTVNVQEIRTFFARSSSALKKYQQGSSVDVVWFTIRER